MTRAERGLTDRTQVAYVLSFKIPHQLFRVLFNLAMSRPVHTFYSRYIFLWLLPGSLLIHNHSPFLCLCGLCSINISSLGTAFGNITSRLASCSA